MKLSVLIFTLLCLFHLSPLAAQDVEVQQIDASNYSFSLRKDNYLYDFRPHVPFIVLEGTQLPVLIKALDANGKHDTSFAAQVKFAVAQSNIEATFRHGYANIQVPVEDMESIIIRCEQTGTSKLIRPVFLSNVVFYGLLAITGLLVLVFYIRQILP